jgi:START domain
MASWFGFGAQEDVDKGHVLDGVTTPKSADELKQLLDDATAELLGYYKEEQGWSAVEHDHGATVSLAEREVSNCDVHLIKASCIVEASSGDKLCARLSIQEVDALKKFDEDLLALRLIESFGNGADELGYGAIQVTLRSYNAPFPVTNREFVTARTTRKIQPEGGGGTLWLAVGRSINRDDVPETPGFVRGKVVISGFVIEQLDDGASFRLTRFALIDPCGAIPSMVVNAFKKKAAAALLRVRDTIKDENI